jgi:hypothetical protein
MTEEGRVKHDAFCAETMADRAPVGPMETFYVSSVAEEGWCLNHGPRNATTSAHLAMFVVTACARWQKN